MTSSKHALDHDDTAYTRPSKRHSPSNSHLPSSQPSDQYLTSSPTDLCDSKMGNYWSRFHDYVDSDEDAATSTEQVDDFLPNGNYTTAPTHGLSSPEFQQPPRYGTYDERQATAPPGTMGDESKPRDLVDPPIEESMEGVQHQDSDETLDTPKSPVEESTGHSSSPQDEFPALPKRRHPVHARDLIGYPKAEREAIYAKSYEGKTVELKDLAPPIECSKCPELADEMLNAYLEHFTVIAKIWSNYDSFEHLFFRQQKRFDDCGKLYLTRNQRRQLNSLLPTNFEMMNIRLDIGTPFRTLFHVYLKSVPNRLQTGYVLKVSGTELRGDPNAPHEALKGLVLNAMDHITEDGITDGVGLTLRDLDEIAKEFVWFPRTREELYRARSAFMRDEDTAGLAKEDWWMSRGG